MQDISTYRSPLGEIWMAADDIGLTGLWFPGQKYVSLPTEWRQRETEILIRGKRWLDEYFSGRQPAVSVPLHPGGTAFQMEVWALLREIPYGETRTYGCLAQKLAQRRSLAHMSAQAVGGAVGRNPISILIPCHRCIGADGSLTGYAGGLDRKKALLKLEGIRIQDAMGSTV